jgi:TatD DNase family protein
MYIDSHAHLTSDTLFSQVNELLEQAKKASVTQIINICTDLKTLERGLELSKKYPWVFNAGATTPHDVQHEGELYFKGFEKAAKNGHLIGIGETGLDYHYEHSPKGMQQEYFKRYMNLALECNLPLIVHCREAFEDFFTLIDDYYPSQRGALHCFTGKQEEATELVKRGWMVSFSGIITFKKSEELREALRIVPLEQLLIETDSPYLAPQSKRGKTNEPSYIVETAQKISEIKKVPLKEVAQITSANACHFFQIACE